MNRILVGIIFLFYHDGIYCISCLRSSARAAKLTHYTESGPWLNWYQSITDLNHGLVYTQPIPMTLR